MLKKGTMDEDIDDSSVSDFDDDEDPDKIEVPGGGKDLAAAASISETKELREHKMKQQAGKSNVKVPPVNMMNNFHPQSPFAGYDMMRNPC